MIDTRKLEIELVRICRGHGIQSTEFHGVHYIGIATSRADEDAVRIPSMPRTAAVSLATLARDIAEAIA